MIITVVQCINTVQRCEWLDGCMPRIWRISYHV